MDSLAIQKKYNAIAKYECASEFLAMTPEKASIELMHIDSMKSLSLSVINEETPSLVSLNKNVGIQKTIAYLALWLTDFFGDVNLKTPVTSRQLIKLSKLIVRGFPNLTIADLSMFLENIMLGKYVTFFYSELSIPNFTEGLSKFWEDRMEAVYKLNNQLNEDKYQDLDNIEYCAPPDSLKIMINKINKNKQ